MNYLFAQFAATASLVGAATFANAASIDVLWTHGNASYNSQIATLASGANTYDPDGDGSLDWNLTLWDGSAVNFDDYDVLVVGSSCNTSSTATSNGACGGSNGFFGTGVEIGGVLTNKTEIEAARGNRTFLSGQDADWHYTNTPGAVDNGPLGFLVNAVNWAASGTGLGIVSMADRYANNDGWWTNDNSFLKDELGTAPFHYQNDDVDISLGQSAFPVNEGLTDAGLSDWFTSSHACFSGVRDYAAINIAGAGAQTGCGVTIVSASSAGGGTGGPDTPNVVPLPAAGWLLLCGVLGLFGVRRRTA
ncbi:MAG: VPLPA-CTERM sorting domain-containing protein [Paracoccaceae bacterium]